MPIFRNGPLGRRQAHSTYVRPSTPQVRPPATPPAASLPPAASPAKLAQSSLGAQDLPSVVPSATTAGPGDLIKGLGNFFGGASKKLEELSSLPPGVGLAEAMRANNGVQLSPDERRQVEEAAGVLNRLAGADGMWNRGDLQNNVKQLERSGDLRSAVHQEIGRRWGQELGQRGPLGRALVNGHMRRNYGKYEQQGMQQARQMAQQQLGQGLNQGGVRPNAGHDAKKAEQAGTEAARAAGQPISRSEMEKFQKTMEMLQEKSKSQGLPQVSFPNGVPAKFLQAVAQGKSPQDALKEAGAQVKWGNGQVTDYGKQADTNKKPESEAGKPAENGKSSEAAENPTPPTSEVNSEVKASEDSATSQGETSQPPEAVNGLSDSQAGGEVEATEETHADSEMAGSDTAEAETEAADTEPEMESEPEPETEPEPEPEPEPAASE